MEEPPVINLLLSTVCVITSSYHAGGCIMAERGLNVADQLCWKCARGCYIVFSVTN